MSSNRPTKFEHFRFMGDKRTQLVYDLDSWSDVAVTTEIAELGVGLAVRRNTKEEARNRGYTLATPGASRRLRKPRA